MFNYCAFQKLTTISSTNHRILNSLHVAISASPRLVPSPYPQGYGEVLVLQKQRYNWIKRTPHVFTVHVHQYNDVLHVNVSVELDLKMNAR